MCNFGQPIKKLYLHVCIKSLYTLNKAKNSKVNKETCMQGVKILISKKRYIHTGYSLEVPNEYHNEYFKAETYQ